MNLKKLSILLKHKDTMMFHEFKNFIEASFLSKNEYKLFHLYFFRTDVLLRSISEHGYPFYDEGDSYMKDGQLDVKNKKVRDHMLRNAHMYIGNTWVESKKAFKPLFISCDIEKYGGKHLFITGYSINIGSEYDYMFDPETSVDIRKLTKKEIALPIEYSGEIRDHLSKMAMTTGKNYVE